jgi:hypothetical protein
LEIRELSPQDYSELRRDAPKCLIDVACAHSNYCTNEMMQRNEGVAPWEREVLAPQGVDYRKGTTEKGHSILINSRISATLRHNEVLMWVFRMATDAQKTGYFEGGFGLLRVKKSEVVVTTWKVSSEDECQLVMHTFANCL